MSAAFWFAGGWISGWLVVAGVIFWRLIVAKIELQRRFHRRMR